MRMLFCSCVLLSACATPAVRCDRHLQPINPAAKVVVPGPQTAPHAAPRGTP